jgi:thioredoxin 1
MVKELTTKDFDEFIKEGLVLIDFFADWCMPCVAMGPILEEVSTRFEGKIEFGKVNVGEYQELAQKFNVSSIPNFTLLKNGEILEQFIGSMSEEEFEDKLNKHLE